MRARKQPRQAGCTESIAAAVQGLEVHAAQSVLAEYYVPATWRMMMALAGRQSDQLCCLAEVHSAAPFGH